MPSQFGEVPDDLADLNSRGLINALIERGLIIHALPNKYLLHTDLHLRVYLPEPVKGQLGNI